MKVLKICIIVFSFGVFTSCQRNTSCPAEKSSSATQVNTAPASGENPAIISVTDTPGNGNMSSGKNSGDKKHVSKSKNKKPVKIIYVNESKQYTGNRRDTNSGPDLEASKKRESNFTNGIGPDHLKK